ncbi:flavin reductase [Amorphus orientalis]|uniref:Flavin reductase (DIM6/NTAB) family NADH-FMN oxidoreductase RutF/DNA-binding MarR family transcriptional regulator n=1 Tax=Amorphus orientalis TaxID=649198 RepID=A0AAE3VMK4_9HYPH|nr:flavin reductase [Amorphus orientalis]MDQ0315264.1 flavin reductase (DIM6/NTAB) family NADH-FMN oxidoreductase RutF/DNA-binding MarR family transcriptional regulator [Amorphus orientalis]
MDDTDPRALRRTLGQFATGVTVITAMDPQDGTVVGMTANSFSSVSLDPPLILWSIVREAKSLPVFMRATHFAVNVLSKEQLDQSNRFARPGADKFEDIEWSSGLGGAPVLPGTAAVFECARHVEHDGGDHLIMIGRVERFARYDREGLVFARGRYGVTAEHPLVDEQATAATPPGERHPYDDFLIPLLHRAYSTLFEAFSTHLDREGITGPEMRVLAYLSLRSGADREQISRGSYLGSQTTDEAIDRLAGQGLVAPGGDGGLRLTEAGASRFKTLIEHAERFEIEGLTEVDAVDVATLKRLLRRLTS